MNLQDLKERLANLALSFPELRLVYLFGSQAAGQAGPQSDYDFGLLADRGSDTKERRAALEHALAVLLDMERLDVVWLQQAPVELAFAVIQGVLVYERDLADRVEYEAQVMSRHCDYLPYLRAQRAEILAGGDHAARVQRYREALGRTERTLREIRAAQGQK
ncbi:MAG: nucleotidyltransferase domain-containing protein [Deltaproteobacteria bacterium]|nr:nucleotidyltransferase domain-containing protein [Deltaproteobacteria bacterium]